MNELIYNEWHFSRPELATEYLKALMKGSGDPIALQCSRRLGKTTFLLNEMTSAATDAGLQCVYIDVWQSRGDVLSAINYGLQEAIDDIEVPDSKLRRRLKTEVKKVGIGPLAMDFGEEPARRRPDSPYLLVDWLLKTLIRRASKPVLLMFDEIQELAIPKEGENIVSALRAAITKSRKSVRVIFTGSNQEQLYRLFAKSRAALYEGASIIQFPRLDDRFLRFVAQQSVRIFRRRIPIEQLTETFARFQYQPRALIDLVFLFASSSSGSFSEIFGSRIEAMLNAEIAQPLLNALTPLQRQIATRIASDQDVASADARRHYAKTLRRKSVSPGSIANALKALVQKHVISKPAGSHGQYTFDDPAFREWLRLSNDRPPLPYSLTNRRLEPPDERDALTGVHNRRQVERELMAMLEDSDAQQLPLSFILVDVDRLKQLNDAHGHTVGDEALRQVAARLRRLLRPKDILGRWGGDEFAIVLGDTPAAQGLDVASQICSDAQGSTIPLPIGEATLTVSCGVATFLTGSGETYDRLIARADEGLYAAKKAGRACARMGAAP
ncbi:MAG TPA: GGDEF domain-containing protein [Steroidobacteraceae bacterium]|jgi:diguanylate cyclase (GGDEF)-like protein